MTRPCANRRSFGAVLLATCLTIVESSRQVLARSLIAAAVRAGAPRVDVSP